jgi:uncharacterized membrane protein HdeD (DUF308 family)
MRNNVAGLCNRSRFLCVLRGVLRREEVRSMVPRLLGYALAAFMAFMGVQKFIGGVPVFQIIEANADTQWGLQLPWIEPWFRYFTGALELLAALLLVFGRRLQGGALALLIILGAIAAHLTVLGVSTPMSGEPGAPESPMLFYMALGALALTAAVLLLATRKSA